jgi:hypothetical protein
VADGEEERLTPAAVERGADVEDEGHEQTNVLRYHGQGVQIKKGGGLMLKNGVVQVWCRSSRCVVVIFFGFPGRSALKSGAIKGSMEARFGGGALLLGGCSLAFSVGGASKGSIAGCLCLARGVVLGLTRGLSLAIGGEQGSR